MKLVPLPDIQSRIYRIRGQQVMLDRELAYLYGVTTFNLNKAVKRNIDRFPPDFMFRLTQPEYDALRFQIGILKRGQHAKYLPHVFTQEGVAMLSGVLHSPKAVAVHVAIMRAFVKLRHALGAHKDLAVKVERLEGKVNLIETDVRYIREDIRKLKNPPEKTGPQIKGFSKE